LRLAASRPFKIVAAGARREKPERTSEFLTIVPSKLIHGEGHRHRQPPLKLLILHSFPLRYLRKDSCSALSRSNDVQEILGDKMRFAATHAKSL
jgi:hypothetical protein